MACVACNKLQQNDSYSLCEAHYEQYVREYNEWVGQVNYDVDWSRDIQHEITKEIGEKNEEEREKASASKF